MTREQKFLDKLNLKEIPYYCDCVLTHFDGAKRVGMVRKDKCFFNLAPYRTRKEMTVREFESIIDLEVIISNS